MKKLVSKLLIMFLLFQATFGVESFISYASGSTAIIYDYIISEYRASGSILPGGAFTINGKEYAVDDNFDMENIRYVPSLENKYVLYELHNDKVAAVYRLNQVIEPEISIFYDVENIKYENGKYSKNNFDVKIRIKNSLTKEFKEKLNNNVNLISSGKNNLKFKVKDLTMSKADKDEVVQFKTGWWPLEKQDSVTRSVNEEISCGSYKEFTFPVVFNNSSQGSAFETIGNTVIVTSAFDIFNEEKTTSETIQIANLDYAKKQAEIAKKNTEAGKELTEALSTKDIGKVSIAGTSWNDTFDSEQKAAIADYLYAWVSELSVAATVGYASFGNDIDENTANEIGDYVMDMLGVEEIPTYTPTARRLVAGSSMSGKTKDDQKVTIMFCAETDAFGVDMHESIPTSALFTITMAVYNEKTGEKIGTNETFAATYKNLDKFVAQLQSFAKKSIYNIGKKVYGFNAKKMAESIVNGVTAKFLNGSDHKFKIVDKLSGEQKKIIKSFLTDMTAKGLKKCNDKIFEMVTSTDTIRVGVKCPVDVKIYNNDDKLVGSVINNVVETSSDEIFVTVADDQKYMYFANDDYHMEITATDSGTMNYSVTEFDGDGNQIRDIKYDNIPLSDGKNFNSIVPEAAYVPSVLYNPVDEAGNEIVPTSGADEERDVIEVDSDILDSGQCGEEVFWTLNNKGILEITGKGDMYEYDDERFPKNGPGFKPPWFMEADDDRPVHEIVSRYHTLIINEGITSVADYFSSGAKTLNNLQLPSSLETIGESAFEKCTNLTEVSLPSDVVIGRSAFSLCTNLSNLQIQANTTITGYAFEGCSKLETLTIPENVKTNLYSFRNCTGLKELYLDSNIIRDGAFELFETSITKITIGSKCGESTAGFGLYTGSNTGMTSSFPMLECVIVKNGIKTIGVNTFRDLKKLKRVEMPNTLTMIDVDAFNGCVCLEKIDLSNAKSLETVDIRAFNGCTNLQSVVLPNSVKQIGGSAFSGCIALRQFTVPDSVSSKLGSRSFEGCTSLEEVTVGKGITSLGGEFQNCSSLQKITISENVTKISNNEFADCPNVTIYGYSDSYAETYAKRNSIPFVSLDGGGSYEPDIEVENITLSSGSLELAVGDTKRLTATVSPGNAAEKSVSWASGNPSVAAVDQSGMVTAISEGSTVITATATDGSGVKASCDVEVVAASIGGTGNGGNDKNDDENTETDETGNQPNGTDSNVSTQPNTSSDAYSGDYGRNTASTSGTASSAGSSSSSSENSYDDGFSVGSAETAGKGSSKATFERTGKATVRYEYSEADYDAASITVPDTVKIDGETYKVTSIAAKAFEGYDSLKKVTIGGNIKKIGKAAFKDCSKLKKLVVKSTKLTEKSIKGSLKDSAVKTIKAPAAKLEDYTAIFTKKNTQSKSKLTVK